MFQTNNDLKGNDIIIIVLTLFNHACMRGIIKLKFLISNKILPFT